MTSVNPPPAFPNMPSGLVALRIVLVFAVGYFLSYAMRSVTAALAPLLVSDLSLSASELGWLSSAYILSFAAMQIPVGIWLDRYGARRTESALLLIAALGAALTAIGETLLVQSLGRILIGIGVSACLMAAYSYFRRCFPPERQPRLVMYMLISGTSGALVASQPALALAEWIGDGDGSGCRHREEILEQAGALTAHTDVAEADGPAGGVRRSGAAGG